jgi:copper-containing nitrite reductase
MNLKLSGMSRILWASASVFLLVVAGIAATRATPSVAPAAVAEAAVPPAAARTGAATAPALVEKATLTFAPEVPPPITRTTPARVIAHLESVQKTVEIAPGQKYTLWTFNGQAPGPFIRARVGDTLEIQHHINDATGLPHNIDLHCVTGPGGGAPVTTGVMGSVLCASFKLMHPGLFVYHCAAPPVMDHVANGMYGLILVQPETPLPPADREFYVMQSEFYTGDPAEGSDVLPYSHENGLAENPQFILFNGHATSLGAESPLTAKAGETVRIYFGNAGPNKISSFHVIGEIFDRLYREGDLLSAPAQSIQTTLVPAGGAAVVDFKVDVPGDYTLVDHAIFRVEKGAVGFLRVAGEGRPDLYTSTAAPTTCPGCLVHP